MLAQTLYLAVSDDCCCHVYVGNAQNREHIIALGEYKRRQERRNANSALHDKYNCEFLI
jgi:hypothetical protein